MSVPDAVLKGMRETNDLFCAKAIRSRDMNVLDHVYPRRPYLAARG
jgi:hypothetical protein